MGKQIILKKLSGINFRQVIYVIIGIVLLINGVKDRDWTIGVISLLFLYQGLFDACLFGSCKVPER